MIPFEDDLGRASLVTSHAGIRGCRRVDCGDSPRAKTWGPSVPGCRRSRPGSPAARPSGTPRVGLRCSSFLCGKEGCKHWASAWIKAKSARSWFPAGKRFPENGLWADNKGPANTSHYRPRHLLLAVFQATREGGVPALSQSDPAMCLPKALTTKSSSMLLNSFICIMMRWARSSFSALIRITSGRFQSFA